MYSRQLKAIQTHNSEEAVLQLLNQINLVQDETELAVKTLVKSVEALAEEAKAEYGSASAEITALKSRISELESRVSALEG